MAEFLQRLRQKRRKKRASDLVPVSEDSPISSREIVSTTSSEAGMQTLLSEAEGWQALETYLIPSEEGNERLAMAYVADAVKPFRLPEHRLNQLGTAVAEATMNAMEHGNNYALETPVTLQIFSSDHAIAVRISDNGGDQQSGPGAYELPDIEAKLAERQTPRGWGLFLIQNMVDRMHVFDHKETHIIELILHIDSSSNSQ